MKKVIIILFSSLLLLFTAVIITGIIFEEKIINFSLKEVNKHLTTEVSVGKVTFSIIRKFPNAAIHLENVIINDTVYKTPVIKAQDIFLQFDIFKLLQGFYQLKEITVNNGTINLVETEKGYKNYIIWKNNPAKNKKKFEINLNQINFSNCLITLNKEAKFKTKLFTKNSSMRIALKENFFIISTKGTADIKKISSKNFSLKEEKKVTLNMALNISKEKIKLYPSEIQVNDLELIIKGEINQKNNYLTISANGKEEKIEDILSILPKAIKQKYKNYPITGVATYAISLNGIFDKNTIPTITCDAQLKEVNINKSAEVLMKNGKVDFSFNSGNKSDFSAAKINIKNMEEARFKVHGNIENFKTPQLNLNLKGAFNLEDFLKKTDFISEVKGKLFVDVNYTGALDNLLKNQFNKYHRIKGVAILKNTQMKYNNQAIKIDSSNINIEHLRVFIKGQLEDSPIFLAAKVNHLFPYLNNHAAPLNIALKIKANSLNITPFLNTERNKTATKSNGKINITAEINSKQIKYEHLLFKDNTFTLRYTPESFTLSNLSTTIFDGTVNGNIKAIKENSNSFKLLGNFNLEAINLSKVITNTNKWVNYSLKPQQLEGILNGTVTFSSNYLTPSDSIINILLQANYAVKNGILNDFKPLYKLKKHIKMKEELSHLAFSIKPTSLEVKSETIYFSPTEIKTNLSTLQVKGNHNFSNFYTYRIKVPYMQLISDSKKQKSEFGYIKGNADNQNYAFLVIENNKGVVNIGYDFKALKKSLKKDIKEERKELKALLKKEFGGGKKNNTKKAEDGFVLDWGDEPSKKTAPLKAEKKEKKKSKIKRWLDKAIKEDKGEYEKDTEF